MGEKVGTSEVTQQLGAEFLNAGREEILPVGQEAANFMRLLIDCHRQLRAVMAGLWSRVQVGGSCQGYGGEWAPRW